MRFLFGLTLFDLVYCEATGRCSSFLMIFYLRCSTCHFLYVKISEFSRAFTGVLLTSFRVKPKRRDTPMGYEFDAVCEFASEVPS